MTTKTKTRKKAMAEEEIDELVIAQANDDEAWDAPLRVSGKESASLSLPAGLAARAAFLAKLHKEQSTKEWLTRIIAERIELEESAFMDFKKELATQRRA
jgi:hypothetical protein